MDIVAVGSFEGRVREQIERHAKRLGAERVHFTSDTTLPMLRDLEPPAMVLVSGAQATRPVAERLRGERRLLRTPVVSLVECATERAFAAAFEAGADDALVMRDECALAERMQSCLEQRPEDATASIGVALVAIADAERRRAVGQTLRHAGFEVAFAANNGELAALSRTSASPALVVATRDFPPFGGDAALRCARTATCKPCLPGLVLSDEDIELAPAARERLTFAADERMRARAAQDRRRSRRMLHGTICAFRREGELHPHFGYTHNVSAGGLFVRTLAAPPAGSRLWVEMRLPDGRAVHLRATVKWRRSGAPGGAPTPPGFGIEIDEQRTPIRDLAAYAEAYARLIAYPDPCDIN